MCAPAPPITGTRDCTPSIGAFARPDKARAERLRAFLLSAYRRDHGHHPHASRTHPSKTPGRWQERHCQGRPPLLQARGYWRRLSRAPGHHVRARRNCARDHSCPMSAGAPALPVSEDGAMHTEQYAPASAGSVEHPSAPLDAGRCNRHQFHRPPGR